MLNYSLISGDCLSKIIWWEKYNILSWPKVTELYLYFKVNKLMQMQPKWGILRQVDSSLQLGEEAQVPSETSLVQDLIGSSLTINP